MYSPRKVTYSYLFDLYEGFRISKGDLLSVRSSFLYFGSCLWTTYWLYYPDQWKIWVGYTTTPSNYLDHNILLRQEESSTKLPFTGKRNLGNQNLPSLNFIRIPLAKDVNMWELAYVRSVPGTLTKINSQSFQKGRIRFRQARVDSCWFNNGSMRACESEFLQIFQAALKAFEYTQCNLKTILNCKER